MTVYVLNLINVSKIFKFSDSSLPEESKFNCSTDNKQISFGVGQRGCVQLLMDGYAFVKNNLSESQIIWKCSKKVRFHSYCTLLKNYSLNSNANESLSQFQGSLKCRAKVCTDIVDGVQWLTDIKGSHNHPVDVPRKVRSRKKTLLGDRTSHGLVIE